MKMCSYCKTPKPLSEFGMRNRKLKSGEIRQSYLNICKQCSREKGRKYYGEKVEKSINTVYRFVNKHDEVIYVGKTRSLPIRILGHMSKGSHLPKSCYEELDRIEFIAMESTVLMDIKELYYINLYKPKYNTDHIANEPSFELACMGEDNWMDIKYFECSENVLRLSNIVLRSTSTIFSRKRNDRYLVYIEIKYGNKKKQVKKGSFKNKEDADKLVDKLRQEKKLVEKVIM